MFFSSSRFFKKLYPSKKYQALFFFCFYLYFVLYLILLNVYNITILLFQFTYHLGLDPSAPMSLRRIAQIVC